MVVAAVGPHHQRESALLARRQQPERHQIGREVEELIARPARPHHGRDHVVELIDRRQRAIGVGARAQQQRVGCDAHPARQGDEQRRLVLAIAVFGVEHGGRLTRLIAADAERQRDVPDVLRHPAVHRAQRVLQRLGPGHELGELRVERGRDREAILGEPGVPARDVLPRGGAHHLDVGEHGVGRPGERLALDARHVLRRPHVHAPALRERHLRLEPQVSFLNARVIILRHVDDEPRAAREAARVHRPGRVEVARQRRLEALGGVAEVDDCPRGHARKRHAPDLAVRIHRRRQRHRRQRLLLVARPVADHRAVRLDHANPVDAQLLAARIVAERLLRPVLDAVLSEDLNHLTIRAYRAAV